MLEQGVLIVAIGIRFDMEFMEIWKENKLFSILDENKLTDHELIKMKCVTLGLKPTGTRAQKDESES